MVAFIGIALFMVALDIGFLLVAASGAFQSGVPVYSVENQLTFAAASAIIAAGIGILLGLSAELLLGLSLLSAIFAAMPKAISKVVSLSIPGTTQVETVLVAGLDIMFTAIYVIAVVQVLSRQQITSPL